MNTQVGVVKQTSGVVIAVDANGNLRVLNVGDAIFLGEVVKTQGAGSNAIFSMYNGKELSVLENDTVAIDQSMISNKSFGVDSVADLTDLQRAILAGGDLTQLEETAAGAGGGLNAGGGTSRLNEAYFISGGHDSNVNVNSTESIVDSVFAFASPIGSIGTAANVLENEPLPKPNETVTVSANDKGGASNAVTDATAANDPVINPIKNNDTKITGKVNNPDPNTSVTVKFPDGDSVVVPVNNDGTWEAAIPGGKTLNPGDTVTVTSKDKGGESSPVTDVIAPTIIINSVIPQDTNSVADGVADNAKVVGKSDEPNANVEIKDKDGNVIGSGTTDNNGNFSIETTHPVNPGDNITVEVTDKAGNKGTGTKEAGELVFTNDNQAPDAPTVEFKEDVNKDGTLNKQEVGDDNKITAKVTLPSGVVEGDMLNTTVNNTPKDSKVITADDITKGYIEVEIPLSNNQQVTVKATITDKAGNVSQEGSTSVTIDATAPDNTSTQVTINDIVTDNIINNDEASQQIPITGTVTGEFKEGDTITVSVNDKEYTGTVSSNGSFTVNVSGSDLVADTDKQISVSIDATYEAGNKGKIAAIKNYTTDSAKPGEGDNGDDNSTNDGNDDRKDKPDGSKDTSQPVENTDNLGNKISINTIVGDDVINKTELDGGMIAVTGKVTVVDDGTTPTKVAIKVDDTEVATATLTPVASSVGEYTYTAEVPTSSLTGATAKSIVAEATITTTSGNTGQLDVSRGYDVDTTAPTVDITAVTPQDTDSPADGQANNAKVTGTTNEPNTPVVITNANGEKIGEGTGPDGKFDITTTEPVNPGESVTVEVTDKAGNKGSATGVAGNIEFSDTTAPSVSITVDNITDDNIVNIKEFSGDKKVNVAGMVSGEFNQGDTVKITVNGNEYTGKTGADGRFSIQVPVSDLVANVSKSIQASVTTQDKAGNETEAFATKQYDVDTTGPVVDITHMYKFIPTLGEKPYKANIYFTVNDTTATVTTSDVTLDGKQAVSVTKRDTTSDGKDRYVATFKDPTHTSNVTITATDPVGNKSSVTDSIKTADIKVDVVIKSIEDNVKGGIDGALKDMNSMVTTPEGETIIGNLTNDSTPTIKGRTDIPNSLVKIYDLDKVVATTISNNAGEFSIELPAQKDGYHSFRASVENDERTSITKEFQVFIDTQADISLNVSASSKNANQDYVRTISGRADNVQQGKTITIIDEANGKTITTKVADAQGNYSVEVNYGKNKPQVGKVLVSVKDKTGNEATNEVMTEAAQTKVVISQQDKGLTGKVYKYTGHPAYELWEKNGNGFEDVTKSKRGDVTDILQKGGFVLGQAAVQGSHFQGKQIHSNISPIYSDKLKTIQTSKAMGGSKSDKWDTIYHYKGKVAMSGVQNKLYTKFYEIDTAVVVKIDGKIVYGFVTKDNRSINTHNYKDVNVNLNGEHDIEVIIIQASYRKEGTIQVGVVGENNEHVILGYNKDGVKTSFVDTTKLPDDAEYNVKEGSYVVTGTAKASSSLKHIKTTDDDDNVTGTQKNEFFDATKGNDVINAGDGNDRIEVDVDSLDGKTKLDGGNGYDTLLLEAPGSNVDLSKVGQHVDHFEAIDLKYGNQGTTLTVNVMDVLSVTNDPNVLFKISGDGQDTVSGKGQWTRADNQSGTDDGYTKYQGIADTGHTVFIQVEDTIKTDF